MVEKFCVHQEYGRRWLDEYVLRPKKEANLLLCTAKGNRREGKPCAFSPGSERYSPSNCEDYSPLEKEAEQS